MRTLLGMHGAERRDRSVARRPLLYSSALVRMANKGQRVAVGASLHFLLCSFYSGALSILAILLHGWCRCTVPSASIESGYYIILTEENQKKVVETRE